MLDDGDLAKIEIRLYYVNMRQTEKNTPIKRIVN